MVHLKVFSFPGYKSTMVFMSIGIALGYMFWTIIIHKTSYKKNNHIQVVLKGFMSKNTSKVVPENDLESHPDESRKLVFTSKQKKSNKPNYNVHIFYYAWYRNLKYDTEFRHWNDFNEHGNVDKGHCDGYLRIDSKHVPFLGRYSSRDPFIIDTHFKQISQCGIGVVVVSWTPPDCIDSPHGILPLLFQHALKYRLKITLQIEPYQGRHPLGLVPHLKQFFNKYKNHSALYKTTKGPGSSRVPLIYMYIPFHNMSAYTATEYWCHIFCENSNYTIRGTREDAIYVGLLDKIDTNNRDYILAMEFDGFYTYCPIDSTIVTRPWWRFNYLWQFARKQKLMFIPSVSPGYIGPKTSSNRKEKKRLNGEYYEFIWTKVMESKPKYVVISTWNHWREGTQIEPAKSRIPENLDYSPNDPNFFLNLTKIWVDKYTESNVRDFV